MQTDDSDRLPSSSLEDTIVGTGEEPSELEPRSLIGRHILLEKLGEGSNGVVFAAYDPKLERKCALKLLAAKRNSPRATARMRREAQALAQLSHPNVVTVYDVGEHDGEVFIAMEFVEGDHLGRWMETARGWREVLDMFADAGQGLAAAHLSGLVHRDFKPENVMLGLDGRPRVMDFGLARYEDSSTDKTSSAGTKAPPASMQVELTQAGSLLGTPAYMAPEQFLGRRADARSDQFSFCVALYEALHGERPFPGSDFESLRRAVLLGKRCPLPRGATVPRWIEVVLDRGLSIDPTERYASLDELLRALATDPHQRARRVLAGGGGLLALATAAWLGNLAATPAPAVEPCADLEVELREIWDAQRRSEVLTQLLDSELSYANRTAELVVDAIDDYARAWLEARVESCQASAAAPQRSELLERRGACLQLRREALRAAVDELATLEAAALDRATQAIDKLPGLEPCANEEVLMAAFPLPEDPRARARAQALEAELVGLEVKLELRDFDRVETALSRLAPELQELEHVPARVRAQLLRARLASNGGDYQRTRTHLTDTYELALSHGLLRDAALAAAELVHTHSSLLEQPREARGWALHAMALARASHDDGVQARTLSAVGLLTEAEGDYELARAQLSEALELAEAAKGSESLLFTTILSGLGIIAAQTHDYPSARRYFEQVIEISGLVLGPEHPSVGLDIANLAHLLIYTRDYETADRLFERALTITRDASGPEHPDVAQLILECANAKHLVGDERAAAELSAEARAKFTELFGPDSVAVARAVVVQAGFASDADRHVEAIELYGEAISAFIEAYGPAHVIVADIELQLARSMLALGDDDAALELFTRVHALEAYPQIGPRHRGRTAFEFARRLWELEHDDARARSLELAHEARELYADPPQHELAEIDAWLSERAPAPTAGTDAL